MAACTWRPIRATGLIKKVELESGQLTDVLRTRFPNDLGLQILGLTSEQMLKRMGPPSEPEDQGSFTYERDGRLMEVTCYDFDQYICKNVSFSWSAQAVSNWLAHPRPQSTSASNQARPDLGPTYNETATQLANTIVAEAQVIQHPSDKYKTTFGSPNSPSTAVPSSGWRSGRRNTRRGGRRSRSTCRLT